MDNSKKGLPSNECRGTGTVEVTDTSPPETPMRSLEQQVLFFTGTEGSLSMQLHEQVDTGVDVGSNETAPARRSAETGLVKEMRDDVRVVYGPSVNPPESRALHTLAATFLLAFAMLFAAALPAQAQTTIWSATLDPLVTFSGDPVPLGCDNTSGATWQCSNSDRLSDDDFTDDGMTYAVTKFFTKNGVLTFRLDTGATAATQGLTLVIDSEEFVLKEADRINGAKTQWKWNNTTLSWTAGTDVAVSLVVTDAPATGQPTISGGAQVSKTLTAATDDIEDLDGLPTTPTFTYQWVRVDGLTDTDIPGATSETYTLTASDLGKQIKVKVSVTDSRGHAEGPLTSGAYPRNGTVTVVVLPGPCPAVNDWCATMTVADAEGDGRLLGYEYDKFGSLDDDQIEYGDEEFNVWTVHTYKELSRAYFYFGSIPRVPRGTVVTVGEHTFTTDMESDDGSTGDLWHYPAGELPPGLVWPDGQEVRVSLVLGSSPPRLSIADASAAENDGHLMFDVTLSPASPHTVKVDFETTSGGTATEGVDYWPHVYTHVIPYGETTTQMGFALIEDAVNAAGETVMVRLSNAREFDAYGNVIRVLNIAAAEATGTITAPSTTTTNVPGLTIGIRDATGDEDDGYLDFRVRLSRKHDDYVCYDFETISGGTATEGMDYLKFPKATYWMQIGKRVDKPFVRIIDDRVNDNGETVKVKISNARLCNDTSQTLSITMAEATGTIRNTDPLPQAFKFSLFPSLVSAQERVQETRLLVQATPSNRAEATPGVGALDFAHFANGEGIISDLVLMNVATHPIRPVLYFYDKEGHPIAAESMVDLTEDLEVTEDGGLSIQTEMEPLGELTVSTHGRGELVSGSVAVAANGPIGGVLRFDLPDIGVAGVGASPPVRDALFPARRQAGGIRTAAALHNLGEEAITVSCRLMSGGRVLEAVEIDLEANGQEARYIEELFTATDTSDFVGSVRCTAPGLFTGIAVELDEGNRIFTTLPVVPVARAGGGGQETVLYFAHFANGGGTTSDLVFVNVSPRPSGPGPTPYHTAVSPSRPALYFYDQEGNLMDPASVVDLTGDLEITGDGALSIQTEMEPLGELTISTHGRGALVSGSVKVVSEGPIGGVLRYALPGIGVTGVGASPPVRDALFPVRQEGGLDTAAAIRNLTESDLVATCRLMKDGAVLEETQIPLAANGQESQYIEEMFTFTGADRSDFVGSVHCTVPPGEGMFTGVAVEIDEINRILTTLPVVPVQERMDRE